MPQIFLMNAIMSYVCEAFYSPSHIFVKNSDMAKRVRVTDPSGQRALNETNDEAIKSITK